MKYVYIDQPKSLKGSKAFSHYRKCFRTKAGFRKRLKCQYESQYNKIVDVLWKVIAKRLLTNTSGVYLDGIGYLANWMTPTKPKMSINIDGVEEEFYNHQTGGHFYATGLFFTNKSNPLLGWDLERTLALGFKREKWRLLKKGNLYKLNYKEMKKLFFNEKYEY